jgi:hypothetical protein
MKLFVSTAMLVTPKEYQHKDRQAELVLMTHSHEEKMRWVAAAWISSEKLLSFGTYDRNEAIDWIEKNFILNKRNRNKLSKHMLNLAIEVLAT